MIIKLYIVAVVNQGTARASLFEISVRVFNMFASCLTYKTFPHSTFKIKLF